MPLCELLCCCQAGMKSRFLFQAKKKKKTTQCVIGCVINSGWRRLAIPIRNSPSWFRLSIPSPVTSTFPKSRHTNSYILIRQRAAALVCAYTLTLEFQIRTKLWKVKFSKWVSECFGWEVHDARPWCGFYKKSRLGCGTWSGDCTCSGTLMNVNVMRSFQTHKTYESKLDSIKVSGQGKLGIYKYILRHAIESLIYADIECRYYT